jgi:hypothetical protein
MGLTAASAGSASNFRWTDNITPAPTGNFYRNWGTEVRQQRFCASVKRKPSWAAQAVMRSAHAALRPPPAQGRPSRALLLPADGGHDYRRLTSAVLLIPCRSARMRMRRSSPSPTTATARSCVQAPTSSSGRTRPTRAGAARCCTGLCAGVGELGVAVVQVQVQLHGLTRGQSIQCCCCRCAAGTTSTTGPASPPGAGQTTTALRSWPTSASTGHVGAWALLQAARYGAYHCCTHALHCTCGESAATDARALLSAPACSPQRHSSSATAPPPASPPTSSTPTP